MEKQFIFNPEDLKQLPIEESKTLPSQAYSDNEVHTIDQKNILSTHWQYLGHISQIEKNGDFLSGNIANNPVFAINDNGEISSFYNVCQHRGGPLVKGTGNKKFLQCQYHGWTYKFDGSLVGTPNFGEAKNFDKKCFALKKVHTKVWQQMIFVNLSETPVDFKKYFSKISERISPDSLENMTFQKRIEYDIDCNWKVYMDNYLEGYHVPFVHPELTKILDCSEYKIELNKYNSLQHSPLKDNNGNYGLKEGTAWYWFIYPNIMFNLLPGRLQINSVIPLSPTRCKVIFDFCYNTKMTPSVENSLKKDVEYSNMIQLEDIEICEIVQKGLQSNAYHQGRISPKEELPLWHFQSLIKDDYRKYFN